MSSLQQLSSILKLLASWQSPSPAEISHFPQLAHFPPGWTSPAEYTGFMKDTRAAWFVALAADAVQILLLPAFAAGGVSPADTLVDVGVAVVLTKLLGWHWAFLPTLMAELVPGLDLFPTWTAAVAYVTWQRSQEEIEAHEVRNVTPAPQGHLPGRRFFNF